MASSETASVVSHASAMVVHAAVMVVHVVVMVVIVPSGSGPHDDDSGATRVSSHAAHHHHVHHHHVHHHHAHHHATSAHSLSRRRVVVTITVLRVGVWLLRDHNRGCGARLPRGNNHWLSVHHHGRCLLLGHWGLALRNRDRLSILVVLHRRRVHLRVAIGLLRGRRTHRWSHLLRWGHLDLLTLGCSLLLPLLLLLLESDLLTMILIPRFLSGWLHGHRNVEKLDKIKALGARHNGNAHTCRVRFEQYGVASSVKVKDKLESNHTHARLRTLPV